MDKSHGHVHIQFHTDINQVYLYVPRNSGPIHLAIAELNMSSHLQRCLPPDIALRTRLGQRQCFVRRSSSDRTVSSRAFVGLTLQTPTAARDKRPLCSPRFSSSFSF